MGPRAVIYSRDGHDFIDRFLSIAQLQNELSAEAAVLDGEVVASDSANQFFPRVTSHSMPPCSSRTASTR